MKRFLLATILLGSTQVTATATIRTVSNNPTTLAQHTTITAAMTAATAGDTIYVHGSTVTHASFTVNKKLTFIGPGFAPDKALPLPATLQGVTLAAGADGSHFQGFIFTSSASVSFPSTALNNIAFVRNRFNQCSYIFFNSPSSGLTAYSGYLFSGNYFENAYMQVQSTNTSLVNFLFQNNVFYFSGGCASSTFQGFFTTANVAFDHNLFYGPSSTATAVFGNNSSSQGCQYLTLTNNVFVRRDAQINNSFSTFTNNITFNATSNTPWAFNNNVNGGGNVSSTTPNMAAQTSVDAGTANPLLDFTIASGSANNAATDGTDMGLMFDAAGPNNWARSRSASLPLVKTMNVTNPTVPAGTSVNVAITAQQND